MKNERGLSHVEAILSFVLFTGFLIFAFFFFSPFSGNRLLDSSNDYAVREIMNNVTIDMESYAIVLKDVVPLGIVGIRIDSGVEMAIARIEDNDGIHIPSQEDIGIVYFDNTGFDFITMMFSEDFSEGSVENGVFLIEDTDYTISSSEKRNVVSEKRISDLRDNYEDDYLKLKNKFNLPGRVDFGFVLQFGPEDEIVASRPVPEGLEVIVTQERVEVIRELDGSIVFADLLVSAW